MFNIPNLLTACNMLSGILSILLALSGRVDLAPYPIFLGAVLDFLDGFAARLLKQQGELGKQLDSLADMITFGLAPGVMMFVLLLLTNQETRMVGNSFNFGVSFAMNNTIGFWAFAAFIIPFFSMFRLAKFNIDTRQSDSFIGLPTPANTLFFCTFPLVMSEDLTGGTLEYRVSEFIFHPVVLITIIIIMSLMLVAELPLFSLKFKHFKWKGNEIRYVFLITCSLLIPLTLYWSLGIIIILYLILSIVENLLKAKKHEIQS
ncbi:MAG: CDP-alcohol phosphatidyltransferase family protein [Bacteroidota bacterium]